MEIAFLSKVYMSFFPTDPITFINTFDSVRLNSMESYGQCNNVNYMHSPECDVALLQ